MEFSQVMAIFYGNSLSAWKLNIKFQVYKQWLAFPTRKKTHSQSVFGQLVSCPTAIGQSPNHVKDAEEP